MSEFRKTEYLLRKFRSVKGGQSQSHVYVKDMVESALVIAADGQGGNTIHDVVSALSSHLGRSASLHQMDGRTAWLDRTAAKGAHDIALARLTGVNKDDLLAPAFDAVMKCAFYTRQTKQQSSLYHIGKSFLENIQDFQIVQKDTMRDMTKSILENMDPTKTIRADDFLGLAVEIKCKNNFSFNRELGEQVEAWDRVLQEEDAGITADLDPQDLKAQQHLYSVRNNLIYILL